MSEPEDHPLKQWLTDYVPDETDAALKRQFLHMTDQQRTTELQNFSSWLKDDSSLRAKSQLLKLGRELNVLHQSMRRAGR